MSVKDILFTIQVDRSRLHKEEVIKQHEDNDELKEVFNLALNPYIQFYIRKIPLYENIGMDRGLLWAFKQLKLLSSRELTGNAGIKHLTKILADVNSDDAYVVERIIGKDLKCGVQGKTVNKVLGKNFIPEYPCMLAKPYTQKNLKVIEFPAFAQLKMDGMRANIIIENGGVTIRSRSGKEINLLGEMTEQTLMLTSARDKAIGFYDCVIDGELVVVEDGVILDRKTGNGILNKAVKGTISKEEAKKVRMTIWDIIPLEDFKEGKCITPYFERMDIIKDRMSTLTRFLEMIDGVDTQFNIVHTEMAEDMEQAEEMFQLALAEGEEGIILKNGDSIWEGKRSKHCVKMKAELDCDLLVTEWHEGTGRLIGKMGAVTAMSKDGKVVVNVGSGFNDEMRESIKPEDILGQIISVKYNELITDKKKDTNSLFLPIFLEIRLDKSEADIL